MSGESSAVKNPCLCEIPVVTRHMTTYAHLLTEHFDIWTAATATKSAAGRGSNHNVELYGLKKLRELILELAVRGLLVPQNPDDEPASVLLKKIAAEKARLVKEGKITKPPKFPPIREDEQPFDLPNGWEFARFGNIVFNRDAERIPLSVNERETRRGEFDYYGASGVIDSIDNYLFDKPLLLIGEDGANLINRSTPIAFIARGKYWVNNHAHVLDGLTEELLLYVCLHINAISLEPYITGTAQPKMNQAKMNSIVLSIPPEAEQRRIVAKVDELMALCDQLEQRHEASLSAHHTLTRALLAALANARDPGQFADAFARIADHFDTLFTTADSIAELKQTILQLAVMGKLVRQHPADEPASVLLKRIAAEKAKLVKAGKIKKQEPLPPIREDEKPFELPEGWEFVRLGDLTLKMGSGSTPSGGETAYRETGTLFLRSQNIWNDGLKLDDVAYIPDEIHTKMLNTQVFPGDILLNITGASLGRSTIFPEDYITANVSQHVTIIRLVEKEMRHFVHIGILSPLVQKLVWGKQVGMAIGGLSKKVLEQFEFPVPPLNEQHRIVAKVDELMALCDRLRERITASHATQQQLADALTAQALGNGGVHGMGD